MKKLAKLTFVLAFAAAMFGIDRAAAQETTSKPNVFIDYFWRPTDVDGNIAEQLRGYVIEAINESNRVELIDVDSRSALQIEKERRGTGELSDGDDMSRLAVMKEEGANALIQGRITSFVIKKHTSKDGSIYYDAAVTYTLKAINPSDGKLIASKTISAGNEMFNLQTSPTADEAAMKTCKSAKRGVKGFIEEAFPVLGKVLEVGEVKKDEVKTMYISVGSDAGVVKGNKFNICVERKIAGRTSQSIIGECEVETVEGGDISLAKVKKGGKEVKAAIDGGQDVVLKSVPKKEKIGVGQIF
ncbi:MAG: CsgG/HfaB family protein [Muribaculaceae bacterium]|nr:CsgG/HfaB family protein [Muribaculaceae bacterium]